MAAVTGLGARVRQREVPHTSENYIMKGMGFAVARKYAVKLRNAVFLLLFLTLLALFACFFTPWFSLLAAPAILFAEFSNAGCSLPKPNTWYPCSMVRKKPTCWRKV